MCVCVCVCCGASEASEVGCSPPDEPRETEKDEVVRSGAKRRTEGEGGVE